MAASLTDSGKLPPIIELEAAERALLDAGRNPSGARRVATVNLLTRAQNDQEALTLAEDLDRLLRSHPARVLVITPEASLADAWQARLLHIGERDEGGGIHAEILQLRGGRADHAANAAMPLLRGGLPVCLWWRGVTPVNAPGFAALAGLAQRVLYDSIELGAHARAWGELSSHMRSHASSRLMMDLVWPRLTRWRRLLAQTSEPPAGQRLWAALERIRFQACAGQPALNAAALMLAGWLTSRLQLAIVAPLDAASLRMRNPQGRELSIAFSSESCGSPETIFYGLRLESPGAGLSLQLAREAARIKAELLQGAQTLSRISGDFPPTDALAAVAQELQHCQSDLLFEEAQSAALHILEALSPS